jgi:hypothetical protein
MRYSPLTTNDVVTELELLEYFHSCSSSLPFPLCHQSSVVRLLSTRLDLLYLVVLPLKSSTLPLYGHVLPHKGACTIPLVDARAVPLRWPFYDSTDLRKGWNFALAALFLVMSFRIENRAHFEQLKVSLEFRSQDGFGQIVPVRSGRGGLLSKISTKWKRC